MTAEINTTTPEQGVGQTQQEEQIERALNLLLASELTSPAEKVPTRSAQEMQSWASAVLGVAQENIVVRETQELTKLDSRETSLVFVVYLRSEKNGATKRILSVAVSSGETPQELTKQQLQESVQAADPENQDSTEKIVQQMLEKLAQEPVLVGTEHELRRMIADKFPDYAQYIHVSTKASNQSNIPHPVLEIQIVVPGGGSANVLTERRQSGISSSYDGTTFTIDMNTFSAGVHRATLEVLGKTQISGTVDSIREQLRALQVFPNIVDEESSSLQYGESEYLVREALYGGDVVLRITKRQARGISGSDVQESILFNSDRSASGEFTIDWKQLGAR